MLRMRGLGKPRYGRFANQLFQYAFLRQNAGDEYECAPWIGQTLFGLGDPPITGKANDISGQFQRHSSYYEKDLFRSLFQPVPEVVSLLARQMGELRQAGRTVVGLHLRRGDYGTFTRPSARWCFIAPAEWYLDWFRENAVRFKSPILYVASDEPDKVVGEFENYDCVTAQTYMPQAPFYPDFYALTQCDVLLISNSTFGFAASMLNERAAEFWRPRLSEKKLVPYDPWNAPLVFKDERY